MDKHPQVKQIPNAAERVHNVHPRFTHMQLHSFFLSKRKYKSELFNYHDDTAAE